MREEHRFVCVCLLWTFPSIPAEITDKHFYLYVAQQNVRIILISLDKLTCKYLNTKSFWLHCR